MERISGIAQTIGGQITSRIQADQRKNELVKGKIKVLAPKAISGGQINNDDLYELEYKTEPDEKKTTQRGDIVLKLSTPYDAVYIDEKNAGLLVTSFCAIVRCNQKQVNPKFLTAFFNSESYRNQVLKEVSGATVPMLTIGKINEVELNMYDPKEQEQIAEYYECIVEKEALYKKTISLEKEKLDTVFGCH